MKTRITVGCLALSCLALVFLVSGVLADAPSPDEAAPRPPQQVAARPPSPQQPAATKAPSELPERVEALEKENVVLREDLGKARLDARTQLEEAAERRAEMETRLQQRIDELNAQLAAERERQARRNKNLWLAVGILALGVIASN